MWKIFNFILVHFCDIGQIFFVIYGKILKTKFNHLVTSMTAYVSVTLCKGERELVCEIGIVMKGDSFCLELCVCHILHLKLHTAVLISLSLAFYLSQCDQNRPNINSLWYFSEVIFSIWQNLNLNLGKHAVQQIFIVK